MYKRAIVVILTLIGAVTVATAVNKKFGLTDH